MFGDKVFETAFGLSSFSDVHSGKRVEQSKYVQKPQHHSDDHDAVQDRLNGGLHRNEPIDQPQEDTHHDQNFDELK
jgi:hypothetical protein